MMAHSYRWGAVLSAAVTVFALLGAPQASASQPSIAPIPADFSWGVASAGFQSEGSAPDSNWRRYVDGETSAIEQPYVNAVDFRHRYREDIARARDMGLQTFRFSVEWARVQPRPGVWDQDELAYYDDVVRTIEQAGMRPMITLNHWVHPGWVTDRGGWTVDSTVHSFVDFARAVVDRYRHRDVSWITFNEPTQYIYQELINGGINPLQVLPMADRLAAAHRASYDEIHRIDPTSMVSSNLSYVPPPLQEPAHALVLNKINDKLDFISLDYYYSASLDNLSAIHAASGELWKIRQQPEGLYYALKDYHQRFPNLPIYIVETGMPTDDAKPRADGYTRTDSLTDHVYWMQRAMAEGVPVIGYNYWSITDNYEWGSYRPRFGLYTVDALSDSQLTRKPTDAVRAYRELVRHHGVDPEYVPVRQPAWCAFGDLGSCLHPPTAGSPPTPR